MGLFDNIWPKSSYVSMANNEKEARRSRQTSSPLLAEQNYNNNYDAIASIGGQSSSAQKLILRKFNFDAKDNTEEYEVKLNDNLISIAARFWTTPANIKQLNRLATNHVFVSQVILVPKMEVKKNNVK